ncbi:hypothetical protein Tco_1166941 [Tanacetum coccineum]
MTLGLQGFNTSLGYALGTPWDFLDQRFAAIMGYRKKMWGMSRGDVESLGTELERLTCEYAMLGCKVEGCGGVCGASFTQGTIPSIPISGSISLEGFLLPVLLLVIIIATVVVTVVVVVVAIGGVPSILKLSFMVIGFLYIIVFHNLLY